MKIKKIGIINEIINSDNSLIGADRVPTTGGDLETHASGTTDDNLKKSTQPYTLNTLSRFGYYGGGVFYEQDDKGDSESDVVTDVAKIMFDKYIDTLKYYYKNPNKLKNDYRLLHDTTFENQPQDRRDIDVEMAKKILTVIEPYMLEAFETVEKNITESIVKEDTVLDKKTEKWLNDKVDNNELGDKNIRIIADLLSKIDKDDLNKIIKLIEI